MWAGLARPNGLPLSCAAPIDRNHLQIDSNLQKSPDLGAAQRRQLQRRVRRPGRHRSGCHPHVSTTPARSHASTTGLDLHHAGHTITPCTTDFYRNHAPLESRFPTTGIPHHGRAYHFCTTGNPHHGPPCHTGTTSARTTEVAQQAFEKPDSPNHIEKE